MAKINGVCKNIDGDCNMALRKELQQVEKSAPFVCEECGKPLTETKGKKSTGGGGNSKLLILIIVAVVVLGGGGFLAYKLLNKTPTEITTSGIDGKVPTDSIPGDTDTGKKGGDTNPGGNTSGGGEEKPPTGGPEVTEPVVKIENGDINAGNGSGTISFEYGKYTGEIKNFKANGEGTLVFYKKYRLSEYDKQERMAESKDIISGVFKDNNLINGKWFDKDKKQKGAMLTGELGIPQ